MKKTVVIQPDGRNLLEILTGQFYELPSFCAGRGTCKKCKVRVKIEGEKSEGTEVLACQYVPLERCQVEFLQEEKDFWIEDRVGIEAREGKLYDKNKVESEENRRKDKSKTEESRLERETGNEWLGVDSKKGSRQIVVDIGTTTLAMLLLNEKGDILSSWTGLNPQRKYGADVISRIERANRGEKQELTDCIRQAVFTGIKTLCEKEKEQMVSRVVVAGNTTMQHLFAGYPVDRLGVYPFSVAQKHLVVRRLAEFYPVLPDILAEAEYVSMPCISAFVGGDIMAGILEVKRQQFISRGREESDKGKEERWLLLDIGTNGEIVLYSDGIYYTTSTAAGPVFEGGNISCGIGSVKGAIDHVWERNGELEYSTIGGTIPVGICGTGLMESMAVLHRMGILDREGFLAGYTESGYILARGLNGELIRVTQEDVRQFQLAKAAIRSGMELLCKKANTSVQKLDCVYLAGGFGTKLDVKKSCEIGLLPSISKNRYRVLGNAALSGCRVYCMEEKAGEFLRSVQESARKVTLALEEEFQKQYLEYMCF